MALAKTLWLHLRHRIARTAMIACHIYAAAFARVKFVCLPHLLPSIRQGGSGLELALIIVVKLQEILLLQ
jgi:hypothetical protein